MPPELTREAFNRLQAWLDPDPGRAGERYEHLRRLLIDYFRWRGATTPEDLADDVFNRVATQLARGVDVRRPRAYLYEVARRVHLEQLQHPDRRAVPLDAASNPPATEGDPYAAIERRAAEEDLARRLAYVHRCLDALPDRSRDLFLRYHREEGRSRIDARKRLAAELGLAMNALRIRVCRIAEALSACAEAWLRGTPPARNASRRSSLEG